MSQINLPNGIPPHINGVDSSHSSRDSSPSSRTMQQHPPPTTIPQSQLPPVRQLSQNFTNLHIKQATPSTSPKPVSTSTPVQHDPKPALSSDVSPIGTQAQLDSLNNRNTNVPSSLPHQGGNRPQMVAQPRLAGYSNLQNQFNQNVGQNQGGGSNYSVGAVGSDHNSRASSVSASPVRDPMAGKPLSLINGAQADFNKFNAVRPPLNKQMTLPQQMTRHQFPDGVNKTNSLDSVYPYGSLQQQQQQIGVGSSQNLRNIDSIDQNLPPHTNPQIGSKFAPQTGGVNQQLAPSQYTSVSQNMPQSYANAGQKLQANTGSVGLTGSSQSQPNLYSRGVNPNTLPPAAGQNQNLPGIGNQNKQMGFQSQIGVQQVPSSVGQNLHVNQNQSQQQNQKPNSQVLHSTQMPSNFNSGNQNQAGYANQNQPVTSMPPPVQGYNKNLPGGSFPPVNNRPGSAGQMNIASNQARTGGVGQLPPGTGSVGQYPGSTGQLPPGAGTARQFPASTGQLPPGTGQYPGSTGQLPPGTGSVGQFPGSTGQLPPGTGSAGQFPGQLPTGAGSVGQFTGQAGSQFPPGNAGQLTTGLGQFPPKNPGESQARTNLHANRYPTQQLNPLQQQQQRSQVYQQQPQGYQQAQPYQQPYQDYQSNLQKTQNLNQNYNYQQPSVSQMGFNKLWGTESYDLLQTPVILPRGKVETPRISLGNELLDNANCHPDIFRCTMTKIPESNSLLQKSRLPLGVLIHPFRDLNQLPVIQCNTIVRCRACRTYINPFVFFVDNKRWKCNLCYRQNELPEEFQYDPVTKTYGDPSRRPEVKASTIEYIAPAEYMLRPPQPAIYLFLMDVSRVAVESGYLSTVCSVLSAELSNLPGDARTHIGFIAYNSALHFYSLADGLSQPHEMTVLDVDEIFLPCPDNLLVNLQDRMELVGDLLAQLPNRFNQSYDTGSALGAALQAAHKMMSSTGGRVTVFQCTLPNVGPGMLSPREDPSQRAGSEAQHLNPANDFYKRLALECSGQQIAVDLFILNSQYVDIATISGISRFSGGCMHHYPLFKASRVLQNESFERSLRRYLTRKIGFEAVMRIRCSRGLSIHTFHGNFFVRSTDLLSLPNVNPDAGFGMQVAIEENLSDVQTVCFQAALLYTSSKGERRIRVHTLCLPIANNVSDIINSADQQCIIGLLAKMAVDRSMQSSLSDAREAFINVAIDILSSYKVIQSMGPSGSLMAPNCLRLLPLYISALLKNQAFRTGISTRLDDRVKAMCDMKTRPLPYLIQQIYPDLYPIHNLHEQTIILNEEEEPVPNPPRLHLSARSIDSNGAYLMDTGDHMILIICPAVNQTFLNQALGVPDYNSITDQIYELPLLENEHSQRLHLFVNYLNDDKPFRATLQVIRDNSQLRIAFLERLVEDRVETALSYHEFLQHLKTQVK